MFYSKNYQSKNEKRTLNSRCDRYLQSLPVSNSDTGDSDTGVGIACLPSLHLTGMGESIVCVVIVLYTLCVMYTEDRTVHHTVRYVDWR